MYMLRSKARALRSRDPESDEMKDVGPRQWVEFGALPAGLSPNGDGETDVKFIACPEDMAACVAENERMQDEDDVVAEKRAERRADAATATEIKRAEKQALIDAQRKAEGGAASPAPPSPPSGHDKDPPWAPGETPELLQFVEHYSSTMSKKEILDQATKAKIAVDPHMNKGDLLAMIYNHVHPDPADSDPPADNAGEITTETEGDGAKAEG